MARGTSSVCLAISTPYLLHIRNSLRTVKSGRAISSVATLLTRVVSSRHRGRFRRGLRTGFTVIGRDNHFHIDTF